MIFNKLYLSSKYFLIFDKIPIMNYMKKIMSFLAVPILVAGFISCSNSEDYTMISGEWKCASWINKIKEVNKCSDNVHFKFQADKTYTNSWK